jgi:hypothetical protein
MPEEKFSPEQSLELIGAMINKAKNRFSENGHLYLIWGWAILFCSLGQFILANYVKWEYHYAVWFSTWLVFMYQMIYLARKKRNEKIKTYTDDIIGVVWITFVVLMFLFGFLYARLMGDEYYKYFNPGILALYGMPTVLSGAILKFRPLIIGGIFCWALSIVSSFIPVQYQLLLLAAAVIAAWIIPGYLMQKRYKQNN